MKLIFQEYGLFSVYIVAACLLFYIITLFGNYSDVASALIAKISGTSYSEVKQTKQLLEEKGWTIDNNK